MGEDFGQEALFCKFGLRGYLQSVNVYISDEFVYKKCDKDVKAAAGKSAKRLEHQDVDRETGSGASI